MSTLLLVNFDKSWENHVFLTFEILLIFVSFVLGYKSSFSVGLKGHLRGPSFSASLTRSDGVLSEKRKGTQEEATLRDAY